MSSKSDKEKLKQIQEKCQVILSQLLRDEDNKYCVDCDAKGPRWASWNLGIFLCIRCAGIHRNLGVHISKVKSVNLDSWTPEQVACLQQMGNSRARAVYEANLPDNFRRPQTDSSLEAFVRSKYETKKFIAKEWVPPPMPKPSFEFEEEKKKIKEKKPKSSSHTGLEVPLPSSSGGRKSSSPTGTASSSPSSISDGQNPKSKSGAMIDLLGLNDPIPAPPIQATPTDDPFGGFLSATTSVATNGFATASTGDSPSRSAESGAEARARSGDDTAAAPTHSDQENLFAQMSNEQLLQKKGQQPLSKESIMSLYGQVPAGHQQPQQQQQQQSIKMMGIPAGAMFMGQQPPQQLQQQQANMFGVPGQMQQFGGYGVVPTGVGNVVPGMAPPGLVGGVQANVLGTNPFLVPGSLGAIGGGWYAGATNPSSHPAFGQLQHQMASMSMGGPAFGNATVPQPFGNVPVPFGVAPGPQIPGAALGWGVQQPGQTLSTNLWQ